MDANNPPAHPTGQTVTLAQPGDHSGRVPETLARAFQVDPALSWIIPDPATRRKVLPRFFAVMAEQSHRHGEVLVAEQSVAAALFYPPGEVRDGPLDYIKDTARMIGVFGTSLPRGLKVADAIHARHPDPQSYSYLRYVGVTPEAQGKGWGGAIIRAGIARAAENGLGIMLETATPANVAIYSRLGFSVIEEWHVPDGGPKFWTMIRPVD